MSYSVGPNIHNKLIYTNEEEYYQSLVQHIQQTQFFDRNQYAIPNILVSSNKDGQNRKRILVFYPTGSELLSQADYVVFPVENGKYEIPYTMLKDIATDKFRLIDEIQYVVDPLSSEEYSQLIQSIENELSKVKETELKDIYSKLTEDELNDEFNRITSIPNARVKIFALERMTTLMSEYEYRGIELPNSNKKSKEIDQAPKQVMPSKNPRQDDSKNKKPWWKFW